MLDENTKLFFEANGIPFRISEVAGEQCYATDNTEQFTSEQYKKINEYFNEKVKRIRAQVT